MHSVSVYLILIVSLIATSVAAHGYLSYPPPRGIQKESYQVDDLKSPNKKGLCRGEPEGKLFPVTPGGQLTLKFTITAPHVGPCSVYILDGNCQNPRKIADRMDCAAPGKVQPWTINLPSGLSGHNVIRWTWTAQHVTPNENYEQCIDVDFSGSGAESHGDGGHDGDEHGKPFDDIRPSNYHGNDVEDDEDDEDDEDEDNSPQQQNYAPPQQPNYVPSSQPTYMPSQQPNYTPPQQDYSNGQQGDASGGSCSSNGSMECRGSKFAQCSNGQWYVMGCPEGTSCQQSNGGIACARNN